jgi:hypothetical protein
MRKVIFAIYITIDGCCDHTKFKWRGCESQPAAKVGAVLNCV